MSETCAVRSCGCVAIGTNFHTNFSVVIVVNLIILPSARDRFTKRPRENLLCLKPHETWNVKMDCESVWVRACVCAREKEIDCTASEGRGVPREFWHGPSFHINKLLTPRSKPLNNCRIRKRDRIVAPFTCLASCVLQGTCHTEQSKARHRESKVCVWCKRRRHSHEARVYVNK